VFWVPARGPLEASCKAHAKTGHDRKLVSDAHGWRSQRDNNHALKGVLPQEGYAPELASDKQRLQGTDRCESPRSKDSPPPKRRQRACLREPSLRGSLLGRVYEYFPHPLASAEGKNAASF